MMGLKVLLTTQRYFSCFAPRFHYSTTPLFHCTGAKENVIKRKRKGSIGEDDKGVKSKPVGGAPAFSFDMVREWC